ncbi:MAG TPA: hypothetical protein VER12_01915 [Polyangiaceae bacterium]|nr:hypothetical protein [Polyangiaceae bacterium]
MNTRFTGFLKSVVMSTVLCVGLTGSGRSAHAHGHGHGHGHSSPSTLTGDLKTRQVDCSTLCTQGVLTGDLSGRLDFVLTSMTPTEDPAVFLYVGTNTITTATGTLFGIDHGVWNVETGEFVDYMTFSKATGAYSGRTGSFSIGGIFDPALGQGHSDYRAVLSGCD